LRRHDRRETLRAGRTRNNRSVPVATEGIRLERSPHQDTDRLFIEQPPQNIVLRRRVALGPKFCREPVLSPPEKLALYRSVWWRVPEGDRCRFIAEPVDVASRSGSKVYLKPGEPVLSPPEKLVPSRPVSWRFSEVDRPRFNGKAGVVFGLSGSEVYLKPGEPVMSPPEKLVPSRPVSWRVSEAADVFGLAGSKDQTVDRSRRTTSKQAPPCASPPRSLTSVEGPSRGKASCGAPSSTSQKHRNFVSEPIGNKAVTELAGIGPVLGQRLEAKGYAKASNALGMYLSLGKDRKRFEDWLKDATGANKKQAYDCYQCLHDWCQEFV
ncbi:uncharacterized protein LOC144148527, partial [Haemaphysalis longicornis]